ncbi:MAG: CDP-diacylglycerol--glycerol-3-phosphate 3-phosphatidyltransferase [Gammaproteobacteria bacterium]|nr:CDP-diacylglycerol--glycerol-3-phosphate 3-phosphatidyltransferase [Gammaproteobacteria bacterium]
MNLPNKLTTLRLLLSILLVVFYSIFKNYDFVMWIVGACFIIGSITDFLDGYIARKHNLVTGFGKLMDPLADKILVISTIIILVDYKATIPFFWISIIVIFRELLVLGVRLASLEGGGEVIAADYLGKAKTLTQMVSMSALIILAGINNYIEPSKVIDGFILGFQILFYISVVLAVISGFNYFWKNKKYFKTK